MATYAYLRTSTDKQDTNNQKHGILIFANEKRLGNITFVEETASGKTKITERALAGLVDKLVAGDVLVVSELSRLGRSMMEVMAVLQKLLERDVKVFALKGDFELGNNIQSKVLAFALTIAADIEGSLISQRTKESLARKKAEGVKLGRPAGSTSKSKLDGQEAKIKELLAHKVPKAAIARMLEVSRGTLLDFIASRQLGGI
jgi:DNA invertase Pin-like site-specific DNA recombinase